MLSKLQLSFLLIVVCLGGAVQGLFFGSIRLLQKAKTRSNHTSRFNAKDRVLNTHKRMPQYMIHLYKELTTGEDGSLNKKKMPYQANAIRGLNAEVTKPSKTSLKIHFDVGYFKNKMTVTRDEVHLYMDPPNPLDRHIFKPYVLEFRDIHTNRVIREYKVPAFNQGWQVLSLKQWTNRWVEDPSSNKGILVTIYRGQMRKLAKRNPFVGFPKGNEPYLIVFASENVRSLLAWRFLIGHALNSVAGFREGRVTRDVHEELRDVNQGTRGIDRKSRDHSRQSQCAAVKTEVNSDKLKVDVKNIIIEPKVYHMINCPNLCRTQASSNATLKIVGDRRQRYCCQSTTDRRDLAVLLKDITTGGFSFEILQNFMSQSCMWSKQ